MELERMQAWGVRRGGAPACALLIGCASLLAACGRSPIRTRPEAGSSGGAGAIGDGGGAGERGDTARDAQSAPDAKPADVRPDVNPTDVNSADRRSPDLGLPDLASPPDGRDGSADTRDAADAFDGGAADLPTDVSLCPVDCNHLPHVLAGALVSCVNGQCVFPSGVCESDWAHCRGDGNGGCETSLSVSTSCGTCYNQCFGGTECKNENGYHYCGQQCVMPFPDSCTFSCVDFQSDTGNCGSCGAGCYQPSATMACQSGKCVKTGCESGFADCRAGDDGCETQLGTDDDCGDCGDKSCQLANTLFTCSQGAAPCDAALCAPGFANCSTTSPDCEASFATTPAPACVPRYIDTFPIAPGVLDSNLTAIALDGSTYLAGVWNGTVDFDPSAGRDIRTSSDQDGFLTKFNADGSYAWTAVLGGRGWNNITGLATTPTGAVVVAGAYSDSIDLDPSAVSKILQTATIDQTEPYFVELTPTGQLAWSGSFQGAPAAAYGSGPSVAADATGGVFLAGVYNGTFDFDPGSAVLSHTSSSDAGMLVKLSAAGALQSARFYDNGDCTAALHSVTVASDGNAWAVGTVGTGTRCPIDPRVSAIDGQASVFIVKHDASNAPLGKWVIGPSETSLAVAVAAGRDGAIYVGGNTGPTDFDPGPGVARRWLGTYSGGFILALDAAGGFRWVRTVVDGSVQALTAAPDGGVVALASQNGLWFATRVNPDGGAIWSFQSGGASATSPLSLASGAGRLAISGYSTGSVDMDPGPDLDLVYGDIAFVSRFAF
jgi:hypothetical protein